MVGENCYKLKEKKKNHLQNYLALVRLRNLSIVI